MSNIAQSTKVNLFHNNWDTRQHTTQYIIAVIALYWINLRTLEVKLYSDCGFKPVS